MRGTTLLLYALLAAAATITTAAALQLTWLAIGAFRIRRAGPRPLSATRHTIWRDPGDVGALNLVQGPGGPDGAPAAPFQFVEDYRLGRLHGPVGRQRGHTRPMGSGRLRSADPPSS